MPAVAAGAYPNPVSHDVLAELVTAPNVSVVDVALLAVLEKVGVPRMSVLHMAEVPGLWPR